MQWLALELVKRGGYVFISQFEDPRSKFGRLQDSRYLQANGTTAARHCDATLIIIIIAIIIIIL